ncbi:MAG: heme biosynthesis HemY N-terminal domain-containing protein [Gammaproteobacteria bacterium]|jgi:HemY protein|tara:strand:- start:615 stop:1871 length:1257 start_codon:yes stop_codon:yes gene_type:complete
MIKLYLFSLLSIVLALLVSLNLGFPGDPGYLLIAFGSTTFETSLFALLVAFIVLYVVIKLILIVLRWINPWQLIRFGRNYKENLRANSRSKTIEGLLYFTRGSWESSYNLLKKGMKDSDASVVNYLAAAYAAHQQGNKEAWMNCLETAEEKYPAARSTINSLKAQLLFKSNQLEQCVAVLQQMKTRSLNDASLLQLLKEVYLKLNDWEQLEKLLPALEKNNVIDNEEAELMRVRIFMENLYWTSNQRVDFSNAELGAQLEKAWKKGPALYKQDERIVKHYVEILFKLDQKEQAGKAIEVALNKNWSNELIKRYGELDFGTPHRQLIIAESWIQGRPGNASLLVTLGRLAMRNELWGKAREYFDTSIEVAPQAEAHGELARLLKCLGEEQLADEHQAKFVQGIGGELPSLPMPKDLGKA